MAKDWKDRLGVVYSTNPDFSYDKGEEESPQTEPPARQKLLVSIDKRNRKGKAVTLVTGFVGSVEDLEALGKLLKTRCGTGGSVKDGEILIQGEMKEKVVQILLSLGYRAK